MSGVTGFVFCPLIGIGGDGGDRRVELGFGFFCSLIDNLASSLSTLHNFKGWYRHFIDRFSANNFSITVHEHRTRSRCHLRWRPSPGSGSRGCARRDRPSRSGDRGTVVPIGQWKSATVPRLRRGIREVLISTSVPLLHRCKIFCRINIS
jgi:hypothetical protein